MPALRELLAAHQDDLTRRWEERVGAEPGGLRPGAKDTIHAALAGVIATLGGGPPPAAAHWPAGFDVREVVRELGILGDCVAALVDAEALQPSPAEQRALLSALHAATAAAVDEHVRQTEERLRAQAAEHLGFLAHELRTPITSARLGVDMIRKHPERVGRTVELIDKSLQRLRELVDDTLASARIRGLDAGLALRREPVRVAELLLEVRGESWADAEHRGLTIDVDVSARLTAEVDRRLLHSAVSNLLRNAIKFTREHGSIHLASIAADGALVLHVEDECGGLPDGSDQRVFESFVQVGEDRSGFGLGLAITQQAIEAHGGTVACQNRPGVGCRFVVKIPGCASDAPRRISATR